MSLVSRFKSWVFLVLALFVLATVLLAFITVKLVEKSSVSPLGIFIFLALFTFIWIWLFFGELRSKVIKVRIEGEEITVSNYCGPGIKRVYDLSQFDGFETALLPSKYDTYEFLYLIENDRKVVKLSEFYHSNYADFKNTIEDWVQNLGQKSFTYIQELKEIFN